jgi:hypothetical protein
MDPRPPPSTIHTCSLREPFSLAEIGEQLAWLAAALQLSIHGIELVCCTPFIDGSSKSSSLPNQPGMPIFTEITYRFAFHSERVQVRPNATNGQCWHNMFLNPTVVKR